MKFILVITGIVLLQSWSLIVHADKYIMAHLCFKPERPLFMASPYQQKLYKQDINQYKFCIRDFIKEQERAITIHKEAVKKATSDWNEFVEEGL